MADGHRALGEQVGQRRNVIASVVSALGAGACFAVLSRLVRHPVPVFLAVAGDVLAASMFHVAHTMLLGVVLGVVALCYLYPGRRSGLASLRAAAWFAAVYWIAQAGSILLPGTAFADPEFADRLPTVAGRTITQPVLDVVFVGIVVTGYTLESRRRAHPPRAGSPQPGPGPTARHPPARRESAIAGAGFDPTGWPAPRPGGLRRLRGPQ